MHNSKLYAYFTLEPVKIIFLFALNYFPPTIRLLMSFFSPPDDKDFNFAVP